MTEAQIAAPSFFTRADGIRLAYRYVQGEGPLLVFLPGYRSDMEGGKAQAVFAHARAGVPAARLFRLRIEQRAIRGWHAGYMA